MIRELPLAVRRHQISAIVAAIGSRRNGTFRNPPAEEKNTKIVYVRVSPRLHELLTEAAYQDRASLNVWCTTALREAVGDLPDGAEMADGDGI